jgi:hypothetical protein
VSTEPLHHFYGGQTEDIDVAISHHVVLARTPQLDRVDPVPCRPNSEADADPGLVGPPPTSSYAATLVDQSGVSTDSACSESLVAIGCSISSVVAAQLASRFRASCEGDPGSAV